jgi:threonine synthase
MDRFICTSCQTSFPLTEHLWRCPCGGLLDIEFTPAFPLDRIARRKPGLWRYREAIPIRDDRNIVTLGEGFTPLTEMKMEGVPVFIKQEYLFPTGSFKDRGASVLLSRVKEEGVRVIVEDSSGNAGCALGAYSAAAGVECRLFVPAHASGAKLAQIRAYGAPLTLVEGPRENAALAARDAAREAYYASHAANPFFHQGTKTFAYEVCEQLGWQAPDTVVLPAGNGTLLLGAYLGFSDLLRAGIIFHMPKLVAVQAAGCAPLHDAFWKGADTVGSRAWGKTAAEGIAVARPVRGAHILRAVRDTGGEVLAVEEEEIAGAHREMARRGFFVEPTAAAALAGLRKYIRDKGRSGIMVSALTGHGLKGV